MLLDLARLLVGASLLVFASWTDWRWRRAPNLLWAVMAAAGVLLLAAEALLAWPEVAARWPYLVMAPLFAGLVYAFWWTGLLAGGADAKALMALAVLAPFPLQVAQGVPWLASPMPGAFTVLGDSLVGVLLLPVAFLARNLLRGDLRFPALLLGYRLDLDVVPDRWVWPMQHPDPDGEGTAFTYLPSRGPEFTMESLRELEDRGVDAIWVTPKIPYMIPLTLGFLLAFTVGDVLWAAVAAAL